MKNKKFKLVIRSKTAIAAMCDLLCNAETKMVTIDFFKKDGSFRTINGMLNLSSRLYNTYERGLIPMTENIVKRNKRGQCKTVSTRPRIINMTTVSRIAFNKKVYDFV